MVIVIFSVMPEVQSRFLRLANLKAVATQSVIVALGALGMTMVVISGGIDLSAASNIAFSSVIAAAAVNAGLPPITAVLLGILLGGLIGLVNGVLVTRLKLVPFIITLGMMGMFANRIVLWGGTLLTVTDTCAVVSMAASVRVYLAYLLPILASFELALLASASSPISSPLAVWLRRWRWLRLWPVMIFRLLIYVPFRR